MNPYQSNPFFAEDEEDRRRKAQILYPSPTIAEEHLWILNHNSSFLERCRIYIMDNWLRISDWSGFHIEINTFAYGRKYFIGRNMVRAIPITRMWVDMDWTNGDMMVAVNEVENFSLLDDYHIVRLALYIENSLKEIQ